MLTSRSGTRCASYVAVDAARATRVRLTGVDEARVSVIPNAVDIERFAFREETGDRRLALCIVKREGLEQTVDIIARAAGREGWQVDFAGAGVQREIHDMEQLLPRYALAITSGRCALEAIATSAAVIACDYNRIAGVANRQTWSALRRGNVGLDAMDSPLSEERFADALGGVDLDEAREFARQVRGELDLGIAVRAVEALYRRIAARHAPAVAPDVRALWRDDLARLAATLGAGHLAHWRRIADQSDAGHQSSAD